MRQKRVTDPLQRCAYCFQCPDPHKYPSHNLGKFKPAGTRDPTSRHTSEKDIGCPRYKESAEHLKEKKDVFLANHKKTSRHYFVPPPTLAPLDHRFTDSQIYRFINVRIHEVLDLMFSVGLGGCDRRGMVQRQPQRDNTLGQGGCSEKCA